MDVICLDSDEEEEIKPKSSNFPVVQSEATKGANGASSQSDESGICPLCSRTFENKREMRLHLEWCVSKPNEIGLKEKEGRKNTVRDSPVQVNLTSEDSDVSTLIAKKACKISSSNNPTKNDRRKNLKLLKKATPFPDSNEEAASFSKDAEFHVAKVSKVVENILQSTLPLSSSDSYSRKSLSKSKGGFDEIQPPQHILEAGDGCLRLKFEDTIQIAASFVSTFQSDYQPIRLVPPVVLQTPSPCSHAPINFGWSDWHQQVHSLPR